jgi:hypothetical protein
MNTAGRRLYLCTKANRQDRTPPKVELESSERRWLYPGCGTSFERDSQAATMIMMPSNQDDISRIRASTSRGKTPAGCKTSSIEDNPRRMQTVNVLAASSEINSCLISFSIDLLIQSTFSSVHPSIGSYLSLSGYRSPKGLHRASTKLTNPMPHKSLLCAAIALCKASSST